MRCAVTRRDSVLCHTRRCLLSHARCLVSRYAHDNRHSNASTKCPKGLGSLDARYTFTRARCRVLGFPIYGPLGLGGVVMTHTDAGCTGDYCLDSCSGQEKELPSVDNFKYRYYITGDTSDLVTLPSDPKPAAGDYPYTLKCYVGCTWCASRAKARTRSSRCCGALIRPPLCRRVIHTGTNSLRAPRSARAARADSRPTTQPLPSRATLTSTHPNCASKPSREPFLVRLFTDTSAHHSFAITERYASSAASSLQCGSSDDDSTNDSAAADDDAAETLENDTISAGCRRSPVVAFALPALFATLAAAIAFAS